MKLSELIIEATDIFWNPPMWYCRILRRKKPIETGMGLLFAVYLIGCLLSLVAGWGLVMWIFTVVMLPYFGYSIAWYLIERRLDNAKQRIIDYLHSHTGNRYAWDDIKDLVWQSWVINTKGRIPQK